MIWERVVTPNRLTNGTEYVLLPKTICIVKPKKLSSILFGRKTIDVTSSTVTKSHRAYRETFESHAPTLISDKILINGPHPTALRRFLRSRNWYDGQTNNITLSLLSSDAFIMISQCSTMQLTCFLTPFARWQHCINVVYSQPF